jgi:hypothetical protein
MSMTDESACLDADTLAAWADDALDARERATVEAHAADCARCQAMLAAMVKAMPEPAAARSPWRIPAMGWLVPLTAAATAVAIWIAVPRREPIQLSQPAETTVDQVAPARPAAPAIPAPPPSEASSDASAAPARAKASAAIETQTSVAKDEAVSPAQPSADLRERRDAPALEKKVAEAPAASPAAAPSAADAPATARREAAAPAASRMTAFANLAETVVVSSNPSTRFKLLPGGGVQRSADGGATWRTEVTGATATLTAGVSPSPSVCWLIGPGGMIVLTTDGRSWRRLVFPEAVDLVAITAADHESATVTTADGRSFTTADGGRTWSRTPGF